MLDALYVEIGLLIQYDSAVKARLERAVMADDDARPTEATKERFRVCLEVVRHHLMFGWQRMGRF
jgi:hypothetical protein